MEVKDKAHDRRASARRVISPSARFECRRGTMGLGRNILVKVENISQTGARLLVKAEPFGNDEVEFTFETSSARLGKRTARVTRCWPLEKVVALIGIRFDKALSFAELQAITRIC